MSLPRQLTLDETLARAGIPVRGDDLLAALAQLSTQRLVQPPNAGTPLTDAEQDLLARSSGVSDDPVAAANARARTTAKIAVLYSESLTTRQVAAAIGRSTSRVRHLAASGQLYTLPVDRRSGLRFPAWQFTDDGQPLPGLATVLACLPAGLHPLEVLGFFTNQTVELSIRKEEGTEKGRAADREETAMTPIQWLTAGGDPAAVVDLASTIDEII